MQPGRVFRHLLLPRWLIRRAFPMAALDRIVAAVKASVARHDAELRVCIEGGLDLLELLAGQSARARAADVFGLLRVWDTAHNSGVLIYLQLADRRVEILADRGISRAVPEATWRQICAGIEQACANGRHAEGVLEAVERITVLLEQHCPARESNPNELPNRPRVL